jgi:hypothetical protein
MLPTSPIVVSAVPTLSPTPVPVYTWRPTLVPTPSPTLAPSLAPSAMPTLIPSTWDKFDSLRPTLSPSSVPSAAPTLRPTDLPSAIPSAFTLGPTAVPAYITMPPTASPSDPGPVSTALAPVNVPRQLSVSVTVSGMWLGRTDRTMTASVGVTACVTSSWTSTTSVRCRTAPQLGWDPAWARVATVSVFGFRPREVEYSVDAPVLSSAAGSMLANGGAVGGTTVTVSGLNFGSDAGRKAFVQVGASACMNTLWVSDTALLCGSPAGLGLNQPIAFVVQTDQPAVFQAAPRFSYDAPSVTHAIKQEQAVSSLTLYGRNFGAPTVDRSNFCGVGSCGSGTLFNGKPCFDCCCPTGCLRISGGCPADFPPDGFAAQVSVGSQTCQSPTWLSDSAVACLLPPLQISSSLALAVAGNVGTWSFNYLYDPPELTAVLAVANAPTTGGIYLTLLGQGFGSSDVARKLVQPWPAAQPRVTVGQTACQLTDWLPNQLVCQVVAGAGASVSVAVSVGDFQSKPSPRFSYDAPVVTYVRVGRENPLSGGTLTIDGTNFGATNLTPAFRIGTSLCLKATWLAATSVRCEIGPTVLTNVVAADVSGLSTTVFEQLLQGRPALTAMIPTNVPTAGGTVTILGVNLGGALAGNSLLNPSVSLGQTSCSTGSPAATFLPLSHVP